MANKRKPIYLTDKQMGLIIEALDIFFDDLSCPTKEDLKANEIIRAKIASEYRARHSAPIKRH